MEALTRVIGWLLIVVGAAVGIFIMIEPLVYTSTDAQPYSPLWDYALDPAIVISIPLSIAFAYIRKRGVDREGAAGAITWDRLAANALFYGFLIVAILYYWDLVAQLNADTFSGGGDAVFGAMWVVIYALFAPLAVTLGFTMQRREQAA